MKGFSRVFWSMKALFRVSRNLTALSRVSRILAAFSRVCRSLEALSRVVRSPEALFLDPGVRRMILGFYGDSPDRQAYSGVSWSLDRQSRVRGQAKAYDD
jgi:hypothetical protein